MKSNVFNGINTVKTILTSILFVSIISLSFAQNCDSTLKVRNNFDVRPLDNDGTTFVLEITNNTNTDQRYELFTEFSRCDVDSKSIINTYKDSFPVNVIFYTNNNYRRPNNMLSVEANSTKRITLKVTPKTSIEPETFTCLKVIAKNASCRNGALSTNVQVFIPNPNQKD